MPKVASRVSVSLLEQSGECIHAYGTHCRGKSVESLLTLYRMVDLTGERWSCGDPKGIL